MTTNAFAGLGSKLYLQQLNPATTPSARSISAITKASTAVITSAAHGLVDGMHIIISGVIGMPEMNGTYYTANVTANNFSLVTIDGAVVNSSNFGVYGSGGSVIPATYLLVTEARNIHFSDAQTPEIDVTTMTSTSKEYLVGLQDAGEFSLEMNYVPFDPAIVEMRAAKLDAKVRAFRIDFPDGSVFAFRGFVRSVPFQTDYQSAMSGSATVKITGATIWMP